MNPNERLDYVTQFGFTKGIANLALNEVRDTERGSGEFRMFFVEENELQLAVYYVGVAAMKAACVGTGVHLGVNIFQS